MAFNLGDIFVTIKAKTDDLDGALTRLGFLSQDTSGKVGIVGRSFQAAEGTSRALGTGLALIGTTFAGVVGGMVTAGGFTRALNIQDAEAKLKGLGYSMADIKTITNSTLDAVQGTAFSLDQAMTVAASAMAAGIQPGKELTKYIQGVADAATIAGTDMNDMGYIFNKVQATGKVTGETLAMLSDRGVPVLQWLAKSYGVSAEAMTEMVSEGKVDSERFRQVMEQNIGGAALASGDTVRGAFDNMKAAMSRVGAGILTQYLPVIQESIQKITKWFDDNKKAIVDGAGEVVKWFVKIGEGIAKIVQNPTALTIMAGIIVGALIPAFVGLATSIWLAIAPLLPFIAIGAALGYLIKIIVDHLGGWSAAWDKLKGAMGPIVDMLVRTFGPSIEALGNTIMTRLWPAIQNLWDLLVRLKPVWEAIGIVIGVVIVAAIWLIINAINVVISVFSWWMNVVTGAWNLVITVFNAIVGAIQAFWAAAQAIFTAFMNIVTAVFNFIWNNVISPILAVITGAFNIWWAVVSYIFQMMYAIAVWAWQSIYNFIKPVLDALAAAFNWVGGIFSAVFNWIAEVAGAVGNAIGNAFAAAWNWVVGIWNQAVGFFQGIWNKISDAAKAVGGAVSGAVGAAFGAVSGVVKSAINGAIDLVNSAINKVNSIASKIHGPQIPNIPRLFKGMRGFAGGLAIVGDNGPELVDLDPGSNVYTNNESRQMLARNAGAGGGTTVNVYLDGANITSPHVADDYAVAIGDGIIRRLQQNVRI